MAYYAYKQVRDRIPDWFLQKWISEQKEIYGEFEYEGDGNYDGDQWIVTAAYIDYLEKQCNP